MYVCIYVCLYLCMNVWLYAFFMYIHTFIHNKAKFIFITEFGRANHNLKLVQKRDCSAFMWLLVFDSYFPAICFRLHFVCC